MEALNKFIGLWTVVKYCCALNIQLRPYKIGDSHVINAYSCHVSLLSESCAFGSRSCDHV